MVILSFSGRMFPAADPCLDTEYRVRPEMSQESGKAGAFLPAVLSRSCRKKYNGGWRADWIFRRR
jgi:hypothetical protein